MLFKILQGIHVDKDCATKDNPQGVFVGGDPSRNIIESDQDLVKIHGADRMYRLHTGEIPNPAPASPPEETPEGDPDLDGMTVKELMAYAEAKNVEVPDTPMKKAELVEWIKTDLGTR